MHNLSLPNNFSKEIFNFSQKYTSSLSKPHQRNFRELIRGLVLSGSSYLSNISNVNSSKINARKDVKRLSNALLKIDVNVIAQTHINSKISKFKNESVLILSDGGDIQKPHARKMEKVCGNVDGSNSHKPGRGYYLHGMTIYGVESKKSEVLSTHLYSTKTESFKSILDEEKSMFNKLSWLIGSSTQDRIVIEDRGCDNHLRYKYFLENLGCSFITRTSTNTNKARKIQIDWFGNDEDSRTYKLAKKLKPFAKGEKEWFNKKLKKKMKSKIAYKKVYIENMKNTPLYMIFCYTDGFSDPLVLLTDLKVEDTKTAWKYFFFYKKRWEVENFFRGIKQNFNAEKFTIQSYEKIQTLMTLIMLSYDFVISLKNKMQLVFNIFFQEFLFFCKRNQKKQTHHLSILAFIREKFIFLHNELEYRFCSYRNSRKRYDVGKNQLLLLDFSEKW